MLDDHLIAHTRPTANAKNIFISDDVRITVLSDRLFRVEKGGFCDEATQAVWFRDMPPQKFKAKKSGDIITVKTPACELVLSSDLSGCVRFGRKKSRLPIKATFWVHIEPLTAAMAEHTYLMTAQNRMKSSLKTGSARETVWQYMMTLRALFYSRMASYHRVNQNAGISTFSPTVTITETLLKHST